MNTLTIYPHGGLCNKLRVMLSYNEYAKTLKKINSILANYKFV